MDGAAQLDIELAAITQAGAWKSTRMPLQYAEKKECQQVSCSRSFSLCMTSASDKLAGNFSVPCARDDRSLALPCLEGL